MINLYAAKWIKTVRNFGDTVNPFLVTSLTGKPSQFTLNRKVKRYMVSGSVLHHADKNCEVWGSGLISYNAIPIRKPKVFYAVRGPRTHLMLKEHRIVTPEVYGDPVLLFPRIYNPTVEKKYEVGIIPHYADKDSLWVKKVSKNKNVKVIDIQHKNFKEMINDVLSCNIILSSSLHGVVIGDAYNVPSHWISLSEKVKGKGFKFADYYASVNRFCFLRTVSEETRLSSILNGFDNYEVDIDLEPLIKSCPFGEIK